MIFENEFSALVFNVSCFFKLAEGKTSPVEILASGKILACAGLKEGQFFERLFGPKPTRSNSKGPQLTF